MSATKAPLSEELVDLLEDWDLLSGAVDAVITALPAQMTLASERLEVERKRFRGKLVQYCRHSQTAKS